MRIGTVESYGGRGFPPNLDGGACIFLRSELIVSSGAHEACGRAGGRGCPKHGLRCVFFS